MTHLEIQELLPLYAVDALPDDEDGELRIHVEDCAECALLLKDHLDTAGLLATAAVPVAPTPASRARLLGQIKADARAGATKQRKPFLARWVPATALAAFVAVASLSVVVARRIDSQNDQILEQRKLLALVSSPSVQAVPLTSATGSLGATGQVFVDSAREVSGMVVTGLSDPGDRVYALWLIEGDKPKLIENFSPDDSGGAVMFLSTKVGREQPVAVTLEPRPGTAKPQGPVVLKV